MDLLRVGKFCIGVSEFISKGFLLVFDELVWMGGSEFISIGFLLVIDVLVLWDREIKILLFMKIEWFL